MKLDRRKFIKGIGAALAMAVIPVLPKIPEIPVEEATVPEIPDKSITVNSQYPCSDFSPQITIHEYVPGEKIRYQDLSSLAGSCDNCMYQNACMQSGRVFERCSNGDGKFIPERWNKKMLNILYRKMDFGKYSKGVTNGRY